MIMSLPPQLPLDILQEIFELVAALYPKETLNLMCVSQQTHIWQVSSTGHLRMFAPIYVMAGWNRSFTKSFLSLMLDPSIL